MHALRIALWILLLLLGWPGTASAHVGSPEIVYDGDAGPYHLFVAITPPMVIPGLAHATIRSTTTGLETLDLVPLAIGQGRYAPRADHAARDRGDPQSFSADLWIMTPGTWKVRILASGSLGLGELSLPVPSLPTSPAGMRWGLAALLAIVAILLTAGAVSIVGAALR